MNVTVEQDLMSAISELEKAAGAKDRLGPTITRFRREKDLAQKDLAGRLGVSSAHLCDVEKSRRGCSLELLSRLREMLTADGAAG